MTYKIEITDQRDDLIRKALRAHGHELRDNLRTWKINRMIARDEDQGPDAIAKITFHIKQCGDQITLINNTIIDMNQAWAK